jgi:negative regulator of genetic competence ClpC/MecB
MTNQSEQLKNLLKYSWEEAERLKHKYVSPEHFLLSMFKLHDCNAMKILRNMNFDVPKAQQDIENNFNITPDNYSSSILLRELSDNILRIASLEARNQQQKVVDTEHLLLAILRDGNSFACRSLREQNIDYDAVKANIIEHEMLPKSKFDFEEDEDDDDKPQGNNSKVHRKTDKKSMTDTPALDNFGKDLTKYAAEDKLDPIVGRDVEVERLVQILSRRKKNNPVLIGEPGVGKTAIVEGLAIRIHQRKVSRILFDKRVIALDMASIVAGTKYRGQFEERIQSIMSEIERNPNIILFIDEIHTIVGAGSASGSLDAANILKPALSRGELQCIGATTLKEYRESIEKDGALERRFQKIIVEPTSEQETITILKNIKNRYEDHHQVVYSDEVLEACVKLTGRYISDRCFPDKAIDALDEVGARIRVKNMKAPKNIENLEKEVLLLEANKNDAARNQDFEEAAKIRDRIVEISKEIDRLQNEFSKEEEKNRIHITIDDVATTVSMMSGVPIKRLEESDNERLMRMGEQLAGKVIGQDRAIDTVVKAIRRNSVGLKDPNRPIGSFIFLGPTGVGKTLLVKRLAEAVFGNEDAVIRVDMSEFMEKYSVSRLIGAPPGYVGYEEGGQLTEKVRRKPYSIVLLDEIEKAHSDVFNILLQVMDEGRLTDSLGRIIDFKNTIIVMTSNVGTRQLKDFGKGVGFALPDDQYRDNEYANSVIKKALSKTFSPEFLNRIDEIVMFDSLNKESLYKIIDVEIDILKKRLTSMNIELSLTDDAKNFIFEKGYDTQYGARPLKRAIQNYIEDTLSEGMLMGNIKEHQKVLLDTKADKTGLQIVSDILATK